MASQTLFEPSFFRRLARFSLSPRIRPASGLSGHYKSNRKGSSIEFSDIREYLPGDDIRRIDWNAYARTEKLFVKLYMDERDVHYHILMDMSQSMNIPKEKSDRARHTAGMLAWLALNNGDRVDITFLREQETYTTKTYTGTTSFYRLLAELERAEFSGSCNITDQIRSLSFHGNGSVFIISDFLRPLEAMEKNSKSSENTKSFRTSKSSKNAKGSKSSKNFYDSLAEEFREDITYMLRLLQNKKQAAAFIHIVSREEETPELLFTEAGSEHLFLLTDSETGKQIKITPSKTLLKSYYAAKDLMEQQLSSTAARYQVPYLKTISDEPLEKLLESGLQKGLWK